MLGELGVREAAGLMRSKKPPGQLRIWLIGLRYFFHPATLYNVGDDEFHVVFDPEGVGDDLRAMIEASNALRTRVLWRENRIIQYGIAGEGRWRSVEEAREVGRKRRRRRSRKSKRTAQTQMPFDPDVPTYDYLGHMDLDDSGYIDEALDKLIADIKSDYFLQWEAVIRREQGLRLTRAQKRALSSLISFGDEEDDRILYIDEIPRPKEPWYEIASKIVPHLLQEPFRTDEGMYWAMYEGWPTMVEVLETHGQNLSLPEGMTSPLDIFPVDLRHRLWLQACFDALSGLGQDEELTLENERQGYRIEWFVRCLREHKDTVHYFDLTLEQLLTRVIVPSKDEKILIEMMMSELGLTSPQDRLADYL
jgi:hypothetical protein